MIPELSKAVIGSYVFYQDRAWNVSTIYRQCSSDHYGGMYYETIVWTWDPELKKRGDMIFMGEGSPSSHFDMCRKLLNDGLLQEDNTDAKQPN